MKTISLFPFLFSVLFFSINLQAQENNSSWNIAAFYTPQYVDNFGRLILTDESFKSGPGYSNTFGLEVGIPIQPRLNLTVGGAFFKTEGKTSGSDLRWGDEFDGNGGWVPNPNNPRGILSKQIANYIQIPIGVQFFLGNKKIQGYLKPGLVGERFLKGKIVTIKSYDNDREEVEETPFNSPPASGVNNVLLSIGLGGLWNINNHLGLFAEYQTRLDLPNLQSNPLRGKRYDLGLRLGIQYSFVTSTEG